MCAYMNIPWTMSPEDSASRTSHQDTVRTFQRHTACMPRHRGSPSRWRCKCPQHTAREANSQARCPQGPNVHKSPRPWNKCFPTHKNRNSPRHHYCSSVLHKSSTNCCTGCRRILCNYTLTSRSTLTQTLFQFVAALVELEGCSLSMHW